MILTSGPGCPGEPDKPGVPGEPGQPYKENDNILFQEKKNFFHLYSPLHLDGQADPDHLVVLVQHRRILLIHLVHPNLYFHNLFIK